MDTEAKKNSIKLVTLLPDDWSKFRDLRLEALQNEPQAFGATYEDALNHPESEWRRWLGDIVVFAQDESKNALVGMMGAFKKENDVWNLYTVYLNSEYRGKGVSSQLLEDLLSKVQSKNARAIELTVNVHQDSAVALYKKYGFEVMEILPSQNMGDGSMVDEYFMRKDFAK